MDLVDLARIVIRRWYVAAAVLVVGSIAAFLLAGSVAPTYKVEAQSILLSGQVPSAPGEADERGNPYLAFSGSLFTTLSAVTRTVDGQEYRERLDADGTERDYLFTTSQEAPVIITETSAESPEAALELSEQVQTALSETLGTLQSAEGVPAEQQITMRVLTTSNPSEEVGDRNRVLFGVLGVTLAGAVGAAVLTESVVQTRRRSRSERAGAGEDSQDRSGDPAAPPDGRTDAAGATGTWEVPTESVDRAADAGEPAGTGSGARAD